MCGESVEQCDGSGRVDGFLLNMVQVFEDFVATALAYALRPYGGPVSDPKSATTSTRTGRY